MKNLFFGMSVLLISGVVYADNPPATTSSDYTADKLGRVDVKTEPGQLEPRDKLINLRLSGYENADGENIGSVKLSLKKDWATQTDAFGYGSEHKAGFVVGVGGIVRLDYNKDSGNIRRVEIEGPLTLSKGFQEIYYKDEDVNEATYLNDWTKTLKPGAKPYGTAKLDLIKATGVVKYDSRLGYDIAGVQTDVLAFSAHGAFKANSVPIDLCIAGKVGALAGDVDINKRDGALMIEGGFDVCAGIGLGPVGHLAVSQRLEGGASFTTGQIGEAETEVRWTKRVGPIKAGLGYSYEVTGSQELDHEVNAIPGTSKSETKHMINANFSY